MVANVTDAPEIGCPSPSELSAFFQGLLADELLQQLAQHLDECVPCRMTMAELADKSARVRVEPSDDDESDDDACRRMVDSISAIPSLLDSEVRQHIGRYVILGHLSQGGTGDVYKAFDPNMGRICAIKRLRPSICMQPDFLAQFKRECMTLANLDHPTIVRALDAGEVDGMYYLVTEYVTGRTLEDVVFEDGPLEVDDWKRAAVELASALDVIHQAGFVHRDVKPSNIIRTADGSLKLLDLGLSTRTGTVSAGRLGTAGFAAPEQFAGAIAADARADYFSLGATLLFLATGDVPIIESITSGSGQPDRERLFTSFNARALNYPVQYAEIVASLLSSSPDSRPADFGTLFRAIDPPKEASTQTKPTLRLGSPSQLFVGAFLALLVVATATFFVQSTSTRTREAVLPRMDYPSLDSSRVSGWQDPSFGEQGRVIFDISGSTDRANAVAVQSDDRIVVAGSTDSDIAVCRFLPNGQSDLSFGNDGVTRLSLGDVATCYGLAIQPDGKILVAGHTLSTETLYDFALARFDINGKLDSNFGEGGLCVTPFPARTEDAALAIAVQGDGKIVVVGTTGTSNLMFAVARYHPNGQLDESFGTDGLLHIDWGPGPDEGRGVAVSEDGKLLIAGQATNSTTGNTEFAMLRLLPSGQTDTTFGLEGRLTTSVGQDGDLCNALCVQRDRKILLAGSSRLGPSSSLATVVRYLPNGALDRSFGPGGAASIPLESPMAWARAICETDDGIVQVVGHTGDQQDRSRAFTWCMLPTGTPDKSLGHQGLLFLSPPGRISNANALTITADGKAVIAGQIHWEGTYDVFLTKLRLKD